VTARKSPQRDSGARPDDIRRCLEKCASGFCFKVFRRQTNSVKAHHASSVYSTHREFWLISEKLGRQCGEGYKEGISK